MLPSANAAIGNFAGEGEVPLDNAIGTATTIAPSHDAGSVMYELPKVQFVDSLTTLPASIITSRETRNTESTH